MKKNKYILFFLFMLFSACLFSQQESKYWQFGNRAGIKFPYTTALPTSLSGTEISSMITNEGCASISDGSGHLLFYTDGTTVWDKNNSIMPSLNGLLGNSTSTQSATIVPMPGSASKYYIFTVDAVAGSNYGLRYSIVDMTLNGGNGDIISENTLLYGGILGGPQVWEKVAAFRQTNGNYWIIAHDATSNNFLEYNVTNSAVSLFATIPIGIVNTINGYIGYLKFSPDGNKLAMASFFENTVEVFDFNQVTGAITDPLFGSNHLALTIKDDVLLNYAYGVEFSPNCKYLYVAATGLGTDGTKSYLSQYTLFNEPSPTDVVNSQVTLDSYQPSALGNFGFCALQLGPDGRIYVARDGYSSLAYINDPNLPAVNTLTNGCHFKSGTDAISLGGWPSHMGLPDFVSNFTAAPLPPRDCCKDFKKKVTTNITSNNTLNVSFSAGPINIKRIIAEIIDFSTSYNDQYSKNSTSNCFTCSNNSDSWGNFNVQEPSSISVFGFPGKLTVPNNSNSQFSREIVWGSLNGSGVNMNTTSPIISIHLGLPTKSTSSCCADTIKLCVRYKFTDNNCITCDTVVCYKITRPPGIGMINNMDEESNITETPVINTPLIGQSSGILSVDIPKTTNIKVTIYNSDGKELMKLYDNYMKTGQYAFDLNNFDLPDGVYFYKSEYDGKMEYNKILLTKAIIGCNCGH
ncbi:MAG: T9SS C-terminal target domain-containing protein [Ignavibacteriae bacterium]|nr:MAG: T9SS C-terminal target domain-containing protein [Ignavibacteriota bacterium]